MNEWTNEWREHTTEKKSTHESRRKIQRNGNEFKLGIIIRYRITRVKIQSSLNRLPISMTYSLQSHVIVGRIFHTRAQNVVATFVIERSNVLFFSINVPCRWCSNPNAFALMYLHPVNNIFTISILHEKPFNYQRFFHHHL